MAIEQPARPEDRASVPSRDGVLASVLWLGLALLAALAVLVLNGAPLFYFDTAGYLENGVRAFDTLGLLAPGPGGAGAAAGAAGTNDGIVVGSRSVVYSMFLSAFFLQGAGGLWVAVLVQAALLVATTHLICRFVLRAGGSAVSAARVTALATLAGVLGSAAFFTASLMPDIFAPVLLLVIAGLVAFAPVLRWWEILGLLALGMASVVMHPSHLAVALLLVPVAFLVPLIFRSGRWWLAGLLVALIAGAGVLERSAFAIAVAAKTDSVVIDLPFFTARLISDGPGKEYLDEHCPQIGLVTCDLNALLVRPEQLSPDRILFASTPETGSFALLSPAQKRAVAAEQRGFLLAVVSSHPAGVILAALRNTLAQMGLVSIDMTIPDQAMFDRAVAMYPDFPAGLSDGRLVGGGAWIGTLTLLHRIYYGLAGLALVALIVLPQSRLPRSLRAFGLLIVLGVLANAFVTGAISQPANRYGARVIFLFPLVLVVLAMARPARRTRPADRPAP